MAGFKIFISQAMTGRKESEVRHERWLYHTLAKLRWGSSNGGNNPELINQFDAPDDMPTFEGLSTEDRETKRSLWLLGRSIQMMRDADIVIMVGNPIESKGMMVEYEVLRQYNKYWWVHTDKDMLEWAKQNHPHEFIDIMNTYTSYCSNNNDELVMEEKEETLSDKADKVVEAMREKHKADEELKEFLNSIDSVAKEMQEESNTDERFFNPFEDFSAEEISAIVSMGGKLKESSFDGNDLSDAERAAFNKLTERMYDEKAKFEDELIREYLEGLDSKWKADYTPAQVTRFKVQNSQQFRPFFCEALTKLTKESEIPLTFSVPVDIFDKTMELPKEAICGRITEIFYNQTNDSFYVDAEINPYNKPLITQILKDIVVIPWMIGNAESVDRIVAFTIDARSGYIKEKEELPSSRHFYISIDHRLTKDGKRKILPLFIKDSNDRIVINYDGMEEFLNCKTNDICIKIKFASGDVNSPYYSSGAGIFNPDEVMVHVGGTVLTARKYNAKEDTTFNINAEGWEHFRFVQVRIGVK